eukprot:scaffold33108_cov24-Tisochrysis_lutea.AAC.3
MPKDKGIHITGEQGQGLDRASKTEDWKGCRYSGYGRGLETVGGHDQKESIIKDSNPAVLGSLGGAASSVSSRPAHKRTTSATPRAAHAQCRMASGGAASSVPSRPADKFIMSTSPISAS